MWYKWILVFWYVYDFKFPLIESGLLQSELINCNKTFINTTYYGKRNKQQYVPTYGFIYKNVLERLVLRSDDRGHVMTQLRF